MVYRLTMRTFMVFEYIHPSGIKLRPARPLTNSISSRDGSGIMTKPLRGDAISKSID